MRQRAWSILDGSFLITATLFTIYMVYGSFWAQDLGFYQTMFLMGVGILCGLKAAKDLLAKEELGTGLKFWFLLSVAAVATVAAVLSCLYVILNVTRLEEITPFISHADLVVGWFLIISFLILSYFHWGPVLSGVVALCVAYFFWGNLVPGALHHPAYSYKFVMSYLGMDTTGGLFWMVSVAADEVYFLVLYASILIGSGMMPLIMEMGKWAGKRIRGGAAFPAVIGSGACGMVMGQAVSNTMLIGQLTIPMMKNNGFSSDFAGGIEATASTSGQFMPPILGLAAFIIASFLNIPYIDVALAALIPALLYIIGITFSILLEARRMGHGYLVTDVDTAAIRHLLPQFVFSFMIVLVLLLLYVSPGIAGIVGIGTIFITFIVRKKRFRPDLRRFIAAYRDGLEIVAMLSLLLIIIGAIAQMATTTNLGGNLGVLIVNSLPQNLFFLLVTCMVIALIAGMGMPTPVCYLVVALLLIPFMAQFGFIGMAAHLFIFYWAVDSALSPPVAVVSLAASKIAKTSHWSVVKKSWKIIAPSCIVPFAFAYNKELVAFPHVSWSMLYWFLVVVMCMFVGSVVVSNYFSRPLTWWERTLLAAAAVAGFLYIISHSALAAIVFYAVAVLVLAEVKLRWFGRVIREQRTLPAEFETGGSSALEKETKPMD